MKKLVLALIAVTTLVAGSAYFLRATSDKAMTMESNSVQNERTQTDMATIERDVSNGALLLDVRTDEEFAENYIAGATHYPLADLQSSKFPEVNKDTPIYVYCRSGNRSIMAKILLERAGFNNVIDLGGVPQVVAIGGVEIKQGENL
jgi:rhodanese-related sulfurtransferase